MKKKLLIPTLLLLASTSLMACEDGGNAFVANGQPYTDGAAANVRPALRLEKEGSIKAVKISSTTTVSATISYSGRSSGGSAKVSGYTNVDLENRTMSGSYTSSGSGQSIRINFNAKEENGTFVIYSGSGYQGQITSETLNSMYEEATYGIYSWNYQIDAEEIQSVLEQLGEEAGDSYNYYDVLNNIYSSFVFSGDIESGTFDVGLAKEASFNIAGIPFTFTKLKYSYKDCFIQSVVVGLKMKIVEDGISMSFNVTEKESFSYTRVGGSTNQGPAFPF